MNDIDEDMWKKQEQINTILDYFCCSDEEVEIRNKRFHSWNWFQKKIYILGTIFDEWYTIGSLYRVSMKSDHSKKYASLGCAIWGDTCEKLSNEYTKKKVNKKTWYYLFVFYIRWLFTWLFNWYKFTLTKGE